jgi:hypothetical protein
MTPYFGHPSVFAILAAISTGAAIITGRTLDAKKDAQISQLQARHITPKKKKELIALLKPILEGPVFFIPLKIVQFSDEIKGVLGRRLIIRRIVAGKFPAV